MTPEPKELLEALERLVRRNGVIDYDHVADMRGCNKLPDCPCQEDLDDLDNALGLIQAARR